MKPPKSVIRKGHRFINDPIYSDIGYDDIDYALTEKEQVYTLDLSGQGITCLDKRANQFPYLKELNLSKNPFVIFPDEMLALEHLEVIKLMRCPNIDLTSMFDVLSKIPKLHTVNLSNNIVDLIPDNITKLEGIRTLYLWNIRPNKLTRLQYYDGIFNLKNLNELIISGHQLDSLSTLIGEAKELKSLTLSRNNIVLLPDSLRGLSNLEYLDLSNNPLNLSQAFDVIEELDSLQELVIGSKTFERLPDKIERLSKIKRLTIRSSNISKLPNTFSALKKLEVLNLDDNNIKTFPEMLCKMERLKILEMQENRLENIPPNIIRMASLENLIVSNNELKDFLPDAMKPKNLKCLDISDNPISKENAGTLKDQLKNVEIIH